MVLAIAFFCFYLLVSTIHASDSCSLSLLSSLLLFTSMANVRRSIHHNKGHGLTQSLAWQRWTHTYLSKLPEKESDVRTVSDPNVFTGNYVVRAKVGTPGQVMFMVMDTTRDATILPCSWCIGCSSRKIFSPKLSSTFRSMDCERQKTILPWLRAKAPMCF
ncbi:hypothetical protein FRX31_024442 [Thalictrum thalictroides]|uniref:Peptidase A1 domain-containing protein n=1 Tax=Thalictrum thalictroides TaxID=46969 RepID=A0A7J6VNL5_THATH|nr:hypothetical protein FRX31_024442 [Thalictrum thalictroides]